MDCNCSVSWQCHGNHAQSLSSSSSQKEIITVLTTSPARYVSVSERQRSRPCDQNLRVPCELVWQHKSNRALEQWWPTAVADLGPRGGGGGGGGGAPTPPPPPPPPPPPFCFFITLFSSLLTCCRYVATPWHRALPETERLGNEITI